MLWNTFVRSGYALNHAAWPTSIFSIGEGTMLWGNNAFALYEYTSALNPNAVFYVIFGISLRCLAIENNQREDETKLPPEHHEASVLILP